MVFFILLGISYIIRLSKPGTSFNKPPAIPMDPYTWYAIVGWPYINNIIYEIGQGILFFMYLYYLSADRIGGATSITNAGGGLINERTTLLREL
jgi:hypothetical protein